MYRRREYRCGKYNVVRIEGEDGAFFDIIPRLGAMVYRIGLNSGTGMIREILRNDSPEELAENPWFRGRVLFPFNDRIPGGRYFWKGCEYRFPSNEPSDGSAIHGLVYNRSFSEKECLLSGKSARVLFSCSLKGAVELSYPFDLDLEIAYSLGREGFSAEYSIISRGMETAPVALGWHPYFSLGGKADDWKLRLDSISYVAVDSGLNPTGEMPLCRETEYDFSESGTIGPLDLDLAFSAPESSSVFLENGELRLNLQYDRDFFPYVQVFIPPDRESIAIEPVTAATNSFNIGGLGRIDLEPGERKSGKITIKLEKI